MQGKVRTHCIIFLAPRWFLSVEKEKWAVFFPKKIIIFQLCKMRKKKLYSLNRNHKRSILKKKKKADLGFFENYKIFTLVKWRTEWGRLNFVISYSLHNWKRQNCQYCIYNVVTKFTRNGMVFKLLDFSKEIKTPEGSQA